MHHLSAGFHLRPRAGKGAVDAPAGAMQGCSLRSFGSPCYKSGARGRSSVVERQLPKLYVEGSIPFARSNLPGSIPDTWVTLLLRTDLQRFQSVDLVVEVAQIVIHERDEPNVLVGLLYADGWAGEDRTEIDLAAFEANAATSGDDHGLVVERIRLRQAIVDAR